MPIFGLVGGATVTRVDSLGQGHFSGHQSHHTHAVSSQERVGEDAESNFQWIRVDGMRWNYVDGRNEIGNRQIKVMNEGIEGKCYNTNDEDTRCMEATAVREIVVSFLGNK